MRKANFSEVYIKSLPIKNKEYSIMEGNLRIRVFPSGTKSWSFYKTDLSGKRTPQSLGFYPQISLAKAKQMASIQSANIYTTGHGIETKAKGITYKEFIGSNHYQSTGKLRDSHKEIMKNLTSKVTGLSDATQNLPIKAITTTHIENYIDKRLHKDKAKKGTINKNLTNIRSVFRVAFDKGILQENIMPKVKKLKDDTAQEKLALTADEVQRLLSSADDMTLPQALKRKHMRIFILLGLDTGLRKGELLTLTWSSFSNPNMNTVENKFQNVLYRFQTPRTLIAINNNGDALSENQMIDLYKADKRTLMIMRFYPSIDQEAIDHQNILKLRQRLNKDGYEIKLDDKITWCVTVSADIAKGREERTVGVSEKVMAEVRGYLKDLYKSDVKKKKGYRSFWWDDNCNPIYDNMVGGKGNDDREAGSIEGYTDVGFMQDRLLFPQSKLSATGSNKPYKPIKDVKGAFTTIRRYAGLSKAVTPHTLRHAFCTELAMDGVDMQDLMRLAGHKDYKTTLKYIHYAKRMDFSALDKRDKNRKR